MEYKCFGDNIIARIDRDEEILSALKEIALKEHMILADVHALGAIKSFTVGVYDTVKKEYLKNDFEGAFEIVSLTGSVDTMNGEFYSHIHMSAGDKNGKVFGGHLNKAVVSATCEMFIRKIDGKIDRMKDSETGLNIFRFD